METVTLQIVVGSYGALLVIIISFLIRLLQQLSKQQSDQEIKLSGHSFMLKEIAGEKIPTIRIEIQKLDDRADKIEHRTDKIERALKKSSYVE